MRKHELRELLGLGLGLGCMGSCTIFSYLNIPFPLVKLEYIPFQQFVSHTLSKSIGNSWFESGCERESEYAIACQIVGQSEPCQLRVRQAMQTVCESGMSYV